MKPVSCFLQATALWMGLMLAPSSAYAFSVSVTSASASPGDAAVPLYVEVSNAAGIAGANLTLSYNASVLAVASDASVTTTALTTGFTLVANVATPGQVRVAVVAAREITSGSGALVKILFDVKPGAGAGDYPMQLNQYKFQSDAGSLSAEKGSDGVFTVVPPTGENTPPVVSDAVGDQALTVGGSAYTRDLGASPVVFTDADGDALSYTAVSSDASVATASVSGSVLTVSAVAGGSATVTVTAGDGKGGSVSTSFSVTVSVGNSAPVVSDAVGDQALTVGGSAYTRDLGASPVVFTDADGDALSYTAVSSDASVATASVSASVLTVSAVAAGTATVTVTADDGKGRMVSEVFSVSVSSGEVRWPIRTVAGGGSGGLGDGGPATQGTLNRPRGIFVDASGDVYIADTENGRVRRVDTSGTMTTVAGGGSGGDGGPATEASLSQPYDVFGDRAGNLYVAEYGNDRVRRVDAFGTISTVAGGGSGGDGGLATEAEVLRPASIAMDRMGNLYIAAEGSGSVFRVNRLGAIRTVAGGSVPGISLGSPFGVCADASGNVYVVDWERHLVYRTDGSGGGTVVAGGGSELGDGGPATEANLLGPSGIFVDASGCLFIGDRDHNRVRKVDASGVISTVAGNGAGGFSGDGGPATEADLNGAHDVFVDGSGDLYIADWKNSRVRRVEGVGAPTALYSDASVAPAVATIIADQALAVGGAPYTRDLETYPAVFVDADGDALTYTAVSTDASVATASVSGSMLTVTGVAAGSASVTVTVDDGKGGTASLTFGVAVWTGGVPGQIKTIAGGGSGGLGDGGPATQGTLNRPRGVFVDASGDVYIADTDNDLVRRVDTSGTITTVAGGGSGGDGGPATEARLRQPFDVLKDRAGNLYIADYGNHRVRKVDASGTIGTVAGGGSGGDGGPATEAEVRGPASLAMDRSGNLYIAAESSYSVFRVDRQGVIRTVARSGVSGITFSNVFGVCTDASGNVYIADWGERLVYRVDGSGTVAVVAGGGSELGDGGPATAGNLLGPSGLFVDASGCLFIGDRDHNRVRKVDASGVIATVAGNGTGGFSGDGGPATEASLAGAHDVFIDGLGNLYIADWKNSRVRRVDGAGAPTALYGQDENMVPTVAAIIPGQELVAGGEGYTRDLAASPSVFADADGDALSYTVSSSDASVAAADVSDGVLTVSPVGVGAAEVTLSADDGRGGTVSMAFAVTVGPANSAPVVFDAIPAQALAVGGAAFARDLGVSPEVFRDADGDTLVYTAVCSDASVAAAGVSGSVLTVTPVSEGTAMVTVTGDDGKGGAVSTTFSVTVVGPPPGLLVDLDPSDGNQGIDTKGVKAGDTVTLQVFADGCPEVIGFGFSLVYDSNALTYVENSFEAGDLVPGATPLATDKEGLIEAGAASLSGGSGAGSGMLAKLAFRVGDAFADSTRLEMTSLGLTLKDGALRKWDVQIMALLEEVAGVPGDFDGDASVGFTDFLLLAGAFGGSDPRFDLDGDGSVGFTDFLRFAAVFGTSAKRAAKPVAQAPAALDLGVRLLLAPEAGESADDVRLICRLAGPSSDIRGYCLRVLYDASALEFLAATGAVTSLFSEDIAPGSVALQLVQEPGELLLADVMRADAGVQSGGDLLRLRFRVAGGGGTGHVAVAGALVADGAGRVHEIAGARLGEFRALPAGYALAQNQPNPFNPETRIAYQLPEAGEVRVVVYNLLGQQVRTLVSDHRTAGFYQVTWDGRDAQGRAMSSGVYLYRLVSSRFVQTRRMLLLK